MQDMEVSLQIRIFFNPSSLSLIKFNYNDPPLRSFKVQFQAKLSWKAGKLCSSPQRYGGAGSNENFAKKMPDPCLDTHDTGKLSRKITHVVTLHQSVKKVPL